MRVRPILAASCLASALVIVGCGGDDEPQARTLAGVVLEVRAPDDLAVIRDETVEVSGSVSPGRAEVLVLGQEAAVSRGTFSATVPLEPGANVIDVIASAPGREPAMTAFRVTREVPVTVPDLGGMEVEELQDRLGERGLKADVEEGGGIIDDIVPAPRTVCSQDPEPGAEVRPGSTVHVVVAKIC